MFPMKIKAILWIMIVALLLLTCDREELELPPDVQITYEVTNVSSFNGNDGAIDVTVTGAEEPVSYFWSNGETTEDLSGLIAGTYTVKITFDLDGVASESIEVSQPEPRGLTLDFTVTDVSRYGKSDGSIILDVSGGTEPYIPVFNGTDTTFEFTGIPAGTYSVTVTDNSNPFPIITTDSVVVDQPDFVCGVDSIADIDGNLYPTVRIENQCWFARNLNTAHLSDSARTPISGRYCAGTNCLTAKGAHYTWEAMMNGEAGASEPYASVQGICPEGWYIPTRKMFQDLDSILSIPDNYGTGFFSGSKIKGEDSPSGFDALYAGNWGYGVYINNKIASFWTSTEYYFNEDDPVSTEAYYFLVTDDTPFISSGHKPKEFGMSVRCIKLDE